MLLRLLIYHLILLFLSLIHARRFPTALIALSSGSDAGLLAERQLRLPHLLFQNLLFYLRDSVEDLDDLVAVEDGVVAAAWAWRLSADGGRCLL